MGNRKEPDIIVDIGLLELEAMAPHEFENGKKGHDDDFARHTELTAQRKERDRPLFFDLARDIVHLCKQRHPFANNLALFRSRLLQHNDERAFELLGIDTIVLHELARRIAGVTIVKSASLILPRTQLHAELAIARVRDEPAAQTLLDLLGRLFAFIDKLLRNRRKQRLRFEEDECGSDDQVFGSDLHIEIFHHANVGQILLGHRRKRNGSDVELLFFDETQEQVERPVENVEPNVECVGVGQELFGSARATAVSGKSAGLAATYSSAISTRRFSLTYLSALRAARTSNHRASSTSWSWCAVSPER